VRAVNLEKLLPADIPEGERILWHGRPRWVGLARRAFRADFVAAYFAALAVWMFLWGWWEDGLAAGTLATLKTLGLGGAALALIALMSFLSARTTLYVITTRRIVLKVGIALPIFINLPFKEVAAASARMFGDGAGDIAIEVHRARRVPLFALWPHARPFRFLRPQPALRSIANAAAVADTLAHALRQFAGHSEADARRNLAETQPVRSLALSPTAAV
jgi:Bacterial PH domain